MVTLFGILDTGASALYAQQTALAVTGNNIANANTPGYSRQRVDLGTRPDLEVQPFPLGTGVKAQSVQRIRSAFLDQQIRISSSSLGYNDKVAEGFDQLEVIFNDPVGLPASSLLDTEEAGLNANLIRFFDAAQELSLEPESTATRSAFRETASTLAAIFRQKSGQLEDLQNDLDRQIIATADEINTILESLLELNEQISRLELEPGDNANNLRDQRDQLLTELSALVPIEAEELESGAVNVTIFGMNAVQSQTLNKLQVIQQPDDPEALADLSFENSGGQVLNTLITSGEMGGLLLMRDALVPSYQNQLDSLAKNIIQEVNAIHSGASGLVGFNQVRSLFQVTDSTRTLINAGLEFPVQAGSFNIAMRDEQTNEILTTYTVDVDPATDTLVDLSQAIDAADGVVGGGDLTGLVTGTNQLYIRAGSGKTFSFLGDDSGVLAALQINVLFTGTSAGDMNLSETVAQNVAWVAASSDGTPGNNEAALDIAQLRYEQTMNRDTADFIEFYQGVIGVLGTDAAAFQQLQRNDELVVESLELRQEEMAGVSLDEEAINMLRFQRAFSGASRFITSVDELIQIVVERMGVVGR
jgi:flagellar hook-associated protein 1 FlgK